MSKFLNQKLAHLNYEEILQKFEQDGLEDLPRWEWESNGWQITFFPIPKKPEARGKLGVRPVGILSIGVFYSQLDKKIKKEIKKKATKYGELNLPYIIAVNVLDITCDEEDIELALFGRSPACKVEIFNGKLEGVWYGPKGLQNQRVSAVLMVINLDPWRVAKVTPVLWHNPWAENPFRSDVWVLPQLIPDREHNILVRRNGINAWELFGLGSNWPVE